MVETPSYISNHEAVVSVFGYWPSFHDSPVLAFQHTSETISLTLHVWETTQETDMQGYFVSRKHHVVRFKFHGITRTDLEHFLPENILFGLGFSSRPEFDTPGNFTVALDSAMGGDLCGSFCAGVGEVTAVLPCDENGRLV